MKKISAFLIVVIFFVSYANAAKIENAHLANIISLDNTTLYLNGYGIRYYHFLFISVKIYIGALYSQQKNIKSATDLINNKGNKIISMYFLHTVKANQITNTFKKDFKNNFRAILNTQPEKEFLSLFKYPAKIGDTVNIMLLSNGNVYIAYNKKIVGRIKSSNLLQKAILMAYFGPHPYSKKLKYKMLGIKGGG